MTYEAATGECARANESATLTAIERVSTFEILVDAPVLFCIYVRSHTAHFLSGAVLVA